MLKERYGIVGIKFYDAIVSLRKEHLESLCSEIANRAPGLMWEAEVRADTVTFESLKMMREAGCYLISIGLESTDPVVLKNIGKRVTPELVLQVVDWACRIGLTCKVFLMCGNPGETPESARRTLKFRRQNIQRIPLMPFGPAIVLPGTELEKLALQNGCLPSDWSWTKPYDSPVNDRLWTERTVPLFTQPGFGMKELRKSVYEYLKDRGGLPPLGASTIWNRLRQVQSISEAAQLAGKGMGLVWNRVRGTV
jgi:hypothetical protein